MRKFVFVALAILLLAAVASASMLIPASDRAREVAEAPGHSPAIELTSAGEWGLERVDFIHYAKPVNQAAAPGTSACYKLLGVKWRGLPVSYAVNPSNPNGLPEEFVVGTIATSAEAWDAVTSAELFNDAVSVDYTAVYGVQDYKNSVAFGDYASSNVIAVTSIWYIRATKQIVEFDMLFNTRYAWGDALLDPSLMDLQNIATHELGHGAGLGDLYTSTCSAVTMYGYSNYGETSKRTLEQPDIAGLRKMYGL